MITINGQKMARSLGNYITLDQLFNGEHPLLQQKYSPITVRFFVLQAHYRSTIDFSNEALQAAEKGLQKLIKASVTLKNLKASPESTLDIENLRSKCYEAMNDDLNSPLLLSYLFEGVKYINSVNDGTEKLTSEDIELLDNIFQSFVYDILGLKDEGTGAGDEKLSGELMNIIIGLRQDARNKKEWGTSDKIREELKKAGIVLRDVKEGVEWHRE
jgi:cysteinyl-tRNA synthetase